jgi:hypothetical protein
MKHAFEIRVPNNPFFIIDGESKNICPTHVIAISIKIAWIIFSRINFVNGNGLLVNGNALREQVLKTATLKKNDA